MKLVHTLGVRVCGVISLDTWTKFWVVLWTECLWTPKLKCSWSPNLHYDSIGIWVFIKEVIRCCCGHEGTLMMALVSLWDLFLQVHTPRKSHVKTQPEAGYLQTKKRVLRRDYICRCLNLGFPASRTVRNKYLLFKLTRVWHLLW